MAQSQQDFEATLGRKTSFPQPLMTPCLVSWQHCRDSAYSETSGQGMGLLDPIWTPVDHGPHGLLDGSQPRGTRKGPPLGTNTPPLLCPSQLLVTAVSIAPQPIRTQVNFMCQPGWAMVPRRLVKHYVGVALQVLCGCDDISNRLTLSKGAGPP